MQANSRQLSAEHIMRRARTGCVREVVAFTGGRAAVLLCAEHCKRRRLRWAAAPWRTFARRVVEGPVAVASLYTGEEDRLCCWMWTRSSWLADSTSRMWTGALVPSELPHGVWTRRLQVGRWYRRMWTGTLVMWTVISDDVL